ncbi:MAG: nucleoside deaminase [Balneolaceae bacterium]|nr:MAG: nucleoside deaminase [Balneolaceae bacterium]
MTQAFRLAEEASRNREIPVGAVVVQNGRIIGRGHNQTEMLKDPTAHAEMLAISSACATIDNKYLTGCTLYVTLEPCSMCAGAIILAKIKRVVFGALDEKAGACGTLLHIAGNKLLNHRPEIIQGVMEADSRQLLQDFFKDKR